MDKTTCVWCGEELKFELGRGWVHMDGQLYKKRPDGKDDHCALPKCVGFKKK